MEDVETPSSGSDAPGFKLFGKLIVMEHTQEPKHESEEADELSWSEEEDEAKRHEAAARGVTRLPCPRCKSKETKFCYFNNYNVNQPRHFCKACHRYWTAGGTLRNVPVGAGRRRSRPAPSGGDCAGLTTLEATKVGRWLLEAGPPAKRPGAGGRIQALT